MLSVDAFSVWRSMPGGVAWFLLCELLLFMFLIAVVSYGVIRVWMQYKHGGLGFKLRARVVLVVSSVGIIPAVLVSGFIYLFFDYGVRLWFHNNIRPALLHCASGMSDSSGCVAAVMGSDVDHLLKYMGQDYKNYSEKKMHEAARMFNFSEILLVNNEKTVLSSAAGSASYVKHISHIKVPERDADVITIVDNNVVATAKLLSTSPYVYVVAFRSVEGLGDYVSRDKRFAHYQENLSLQLSFLQIQFFTVFLFLLCAVLFGTVWIGVGLGKSITEKLSALFDATQRVWGGDFDFKIENKGNEQEELTTVISAFNHMVARLGEQRLQLENAYREINDRNKFVETVLAGVSSGVIAVSSFRSVTLMNIRAMNILLCDSFDALSIDDVFPEVVELFKNETGRGDITIVRDQKSLVLSVNVERLKAQGFIITFEDISDLVEAQKQAAWADVARRVAHEIKNPITPIYLAAERLSSKYAEQIVSGKETFLRYTDTIMRHVSSISGIVDEFVKFARMPSSVFKMCDISSVIREISFLGQFGRNTVNYDLVLPDKEVCILMDRERMSQVFVNIFKNACESIDSSTNVDNGCIKVIVLENEKGVSVEIRDNGIGFSEDMIDKLTDPYVTTRDGGMGLGLAIVSKILNEHGASISFGNLSEGGGVVFMTF
ncbi:ATP-binding protein [Anaplasma bovis]